MPNASKSSLPSDFLQLLQRRLQMIQHMILGWLLQSESRHIVFSHLEFHRMIVCDSFPSTPLGIKSVFRSQSLVWVGGVREWISSNKFFDFSALTFLKVWWPWLFARPNLESIANLESGNFSVSKNVQGSHFHLHPWNCTNNWPDF